MRVAHPQHLSSYSHFPVPFPLPSLPISEIGPGGAVAVRRAGHELKTAPFMVNIKG